MNELILKNKSIDRSYILEGKSKTVYLKKIFLQRFFSKVEFDYEKKIWTVYIKDMNEFKKIQSDLKENNYNLELDKQTIIN